MSTLSFWTITRGTGLAIQVTSSRRCAGLSSHPTGVPQVTRLWVPATPPLLCLRSIKGCRTFFFTNNTILLMYFNRLKSGAIFSWLFSVLVNTILSRPLSTQVRSSREVPSWEPWWFNSEQFWVGDGRMWGFRRYRRCHCFLQLKSNFSIVSYPKMELFVSNYRILPTPRPWWRTMSHGQVVHREVYWRPGKTAKLYTTNVFSSFSSHAIDKRTFTLYHGRCPSSVFLHRGPQKTPLSVIVDILYLSTVVRVLLSRIEIYV